MSTERNGIEGHRDIGDAGSSGIEKDFGYIAREGWGGLTACIALVFALSGCAALPITFGIAQVGMGFSNGDPSMAPDTECPPPMTVGCEADRGWSAPEPASVPDTQDVPDEPDQCRDDPDDGKPGWGRGDKNHDHKGPPGQNK